LRSFYLRKGSSMGYTRGVLWFFGIMTLVAATGVAAGFFEPSEAARLGLLAWQQLLFIAGGIFGAQGGKARRPSFKLALQGMACGVGIYLLNILLGALSFAVAAHFMGSAQAQELLLKDRATVEMLVTSKKPFIACGAMLLLLVGAPLGEELFFRGLLVNLLRERLRAAPAVLLAALLFALLHFYTLQFVPVLVSGVLLGLLYVRTGSIIVPIAAHFAVNALALMALLSTL